MGSRYDDELWETVPPGSRPPPEHLARFVRALPSARDALDLGCGDGRLTAELCAERIVAADVSAVALARARARLAGAANPVEPTRNAVEPTPDLVELTPDAPLPLDDASFDLVVCTETLEHVRDVQLLLSEARRVLRPGGTLAISTPAHGRLTALRALVVGWERVLQPLSPHLRFFTRRSLDRLLDGMGFEVASLERRRGTLFATARR